MRFSSEISSMELSGIRKSFAAAGTQAINLGIGEPDFDTPTHIREAALDAIQQGFTSYTHNLGIIELREALSDKLRRENDLRFSPSEIMVTGGASEALFLAIRALCGPCDEVLLPDPGFLSYPSLTKAVGARPVGVPLDSELKMRPESVEERITKSTRAIIINSPSNPTGAVNTREEMHAFADIATDRDITLISDEVYEKFLYEGEHVSPARWTDNSMTINAVSKTYAMTGWRLGYIAAREEAITHMLKLHQVMAACACSISQKAALAALTGPQEWVFDMRTDFLRRRNLLLSGLADMGMKIPAPKGAFFIFPHVGDAESISSRLMEKGVVVVPGSAFGQGGREHIRISYAASEDKLREALERMRGVLGS